MTKILIVDDHPLIREGIKQILANEPDMVLAGEANSASEMMEKIKKEKYDLVLLDINLPDSNGLELIKTLKGEYSLPVLVLSMHKEEEYAIRTLRAGAAGYIIKETAPMQLVAAIKKVAAGGRHISPSLAEKLASCIEEGVNETPHETLSDRELQILLMIGAGKTPTEIAKTLCLRIKTISTYRARILEKMRMENNSQLMHYVLANKLLN